MKKLILITALISTGAIAEDAVDLCPAIGSLAEQIMTARQLNMPMDQMMEIAGDSDVAASIVIDAYKQPAYITESAQNREIADFKNAALSVCYSATRK